MSGISAGLLHAPILDIRSPEALGRLTCTCMSYTIIPMRTTIEIRDEQRAKLLELAARRGEKGFSRLVQEALELYLDEIAARERRVDEALGAIGSLDDEDVKELRESVRRVRERWR